MHNSWHFESLLNYHTNIVYFGTGKNFLCVNIFILHNFQLLFNKQRSLDMRSVLLLSTQEAARAWKKCREKHLTTSRVSPYFTTEQSTVKASLFILW